MTKFYRLLILFFVSLLVSENVNAVTYKYPNTITVFSGNLNYCEHRAAQPLTLTFNTLTCGAGGNQNVNVTVTWYSNVINSNVGGTPVQTVNSNTGTTTYIYVPLTTPVGTLYYYATVTWAAIGCVTAGTLTTGTLPVTINSCPTSADMPDPTVNLKTVPAGSLVIPMDNSHQNLWLNYPFNIKAYGLIDSLELNDIPVYWVIKSGKLKDSSDFSAVASRVYPTALAASLQYFKASEFIIDTTWLNKPYYPGEKTALQVISGFAKRWKVAVYQLSSNTTVDVRYTLHQRPKIACFNNGTYQQVATKLLDSAKFGNFVAISAGAFQGLADCYTFCMEMHWSTATLADSATMLPVWQFIQEGGNFLGQCAGENTYENLMQTPRHFHTTGGTTQMAGALPANHYDNPDMAFAQFQGIVAPRSGTTANWKLTGASAFDTETFNTVYSVSRDTIVASERHYGSPDSVGGNVFYIGGHDYMTSTANANAADSVGDLHYINGTRMFLNACLIPAHRPTAFALSTGSNQTICSGDSCILGGAPTGPFGSTYTWSPATGLNNANDANPHASPAVTTTYTVIAFDGSCQGGPNTVTVTVNPTPTAPVPTSNSPVCAGTTLQLNTPTVIGATYSWTGPNGFISALQNPTIPNVTLAAAGTYSVTVTLAGCPGAPGTVTVVIDPAPATPSPTSNSPVCVGNALNLFTAAVGGATYSWTGPNGFTSTAQNPVIPGVTLAAAGTYSLAITVAGCASALGTVAVVVNPTPATPTPTSNSPICAGATLNLFTAAVVGATYSWTGPNGFISALQNPTIPNATIAATGTYSLTVTVTGCPSAVGTVAVVVNPAPATPTPTSNSPVCVGNTLNLFTSPVVGATYSWTGPNGFTSTAQNPVIPGVTLAAAGTYSLAITVAGCAGVAGTVAVVINPTPTTPTPTSNSPVCAGSTLNLFTAAVVGATYSWTGPNGFISALQNPTIPNATLAATGTYSLTVTVGGCPSAAGTVAVVINPTPTTPVPTSNSPVCAGSTLNLFGPLVVGATYSWTGPNGFISALQNPTIPNATLAATGTYSLTVTVAGCTSAAGTVNVTINPTPGTPSPTSNSPVCQGSTLTLFTTAVVGATYSWTGPNGFISALQNPTIPNVTLAAAGTYSLTITVGGCASAAGTVAVVINPTPTTPTPTSNSPICAGSTLNLFTAAVVGATYSWTGPNGFISALQNPTIPGATIAAAGTYSLTVSVGGCTSATGTVAVIVNPAPSAPTPTSNSPICAGSTLTLFTSPVVGATYSWTGPNGFISALQNPTIPGATIAATGTYSLTVTVAGCTGASGTVAVVVSPIPSTPTPTSNSPVCEGSTLNLFTPSVAGATYSWTGPNGFISASQNPSIANVTLAAAGTYSVTVTVAGCPSAAGTVAVVINPTPATPSPTSNSPICAGATLNLFTAAVGGATYSWTGPNGFISALQNPTIPGATVAASGTYSLTVTVGTCTSAVGTVNVIVNPPPATPTPTSNSPVCEGSTLNLFTPFVVGGTYSWTGPNGFISALQNPTIPNVTLAAAGTYSVAISVAGCTGVAGTVSVTILPTPATPVATSNSPVCEGSTLNLFTPTVGGATYSWTGPNGFISALQNPSIPNVTLADAGTYSVTITVGTCTSTAGTVNVVINPTPATPSPTSNSPICVGSTLNLFTTAVAGATYSWTGPNGFISALQNPTIPGATLAAAGTYSLTISVAGCTGSAGTVNVIVSPIPSTPTATSNSPICEGSTLNLSTPTVVGATYSWTGPNGFISALQNPSIANATLAAAGTYSVTVSVGGCPSAAGTVTVIVNPTPSAPAPTSNSPICAGSTLNLFAPLVGGATYSWTGPNAFVSALQNPSIPAAPKADAGTYSVTVTVAGCTSLPGTVNVIIDTLAVVSAGPNQTLCANNDSVQLNGSSSTLTGVWTTGGSGTFSPNNTTLNAIYIPSNADTAAGSVTLTLTSTNSGACGPVVSHITINFTHAPTANAGNDLQVCSNNAVVTLNGSFTIASGGIWSTSGSGTFSPNNTTMNATYAPSNADTAAGSVIITLTTTGNGQCKVVTDTMKITYTNAPTVEAGRDTTICLSSPNYTLNGSSTTGFGTWTTLGSGTFTPNNNTLNATYIPSNADTTAKSVILILTSANNGGCNAVSDSVKITYSSVPTANAGSNQTVCANNDHVSLSATSSTNTGVWTTSGCGTFSPNNTTLNATYIPCNSDTAAGSVTLTFTTTGGCIPVAKTITITITNAPVVEAGPDQFICKNNSLNATLNGTVGGGASTGIWSTSGTGTFSPSNTALNTTYIPSSADTAAGSVRIILTSTGNGTCLAVTDTMTIHYTLPPIAEAGINITGCANDSVHLNGKIFNGGGTGIWSTPNGTGIFVPNNTTLNGYYIPSNADTAVGNITLILTSTNNGGCLASSDSLTITTLPDPVVNAGPDQTVCKNNNLVTLAGGIFDASGGIWSTGGSGAFTPNNTTLNATYNPSSADTAAGFVNLILTSTGNGACKAVSDTMKVTFSPSPDVEAGAPIFICTGTTTASLNGSISGGSTKGIWTTLGSGTFSPNDSALNATYNLSNADTAAKVVKLILTSTHNGTCNPSSDTVTVTITPIPTVEAGNDTTACANNANVVLNGKITGGSGTGVWTTTGSGTFTPNDSVLNATYNASSGDTTAKTVTLILTATNACLNLSDSMKITFTPAPTINPGTNQTICAGTDVNLSGAVTVASGGKWSTSGDGTFAPNDSTLAAIYTPGTTDTGTGTVTLYLTSIGNGTCNPVKDSIQVTIQSKPRANFKTSPACLNATINFTDISTNSRGAISGWFWNFDNGTSIIQNPTNTYTSLGLQNITFAVVTSAGCRDTLNRDIYVNPLPTPDFTKLHFCPDSAMFTDGSVVTPGNINSWNWSFGDSTHSTKQDPNHTFPAPGTYTVTLFVLSDSGCGSAFTDTIAVDTCPAPKVNAPAVPSAFTPNGDGNNDVLLVKGGPFSEMDFRVFDEWGNQLFRSTSQSVGWDGKYNGKPQPEGAYTWTLTGTTINGITVKQTGDVTILR